jgi:hypothetical protein
MNKGDVSIKTLKYIAIEKDIKNTTSFWGGGGSINFSMIFSFRGRFWNLTPAKSKG